MEWVDIVSFRIENSLGKLKTQRATISADCGSHLEVHLYCDVQQISCTIVHAIMIQFFRLYSIILRNCLPLPKKYTPGGDWLQHQTNISLCKL